MKQVFNQQQLMVRRRDSLVYVATWKCASSFFVQNFALQQGWDYFSWHDIDWRRHHVFGHIREPIERRHRGILQALRHGGLVRDYCKNPALQKLLEQAVRLEVHSYTYQDMFGDRMWEIDWIPLDLGPEDAIKATADLLSWHGIPEPNWNMELGNRSQGIDIKAVHHLRSFWRDKNQDIDSIYFEDTKLWQQVMDRFNASASTWPEISWLRHGSTST